MFYPNKNTPDDLEAFNILVQYRRPRWGRLVSSAEHDQIWIDIDVTEIETIPESVVSKLGSLGVRLDSKLESLCMFV